MAPQWQTGILEVLDGAQDMTVATLRDDGFPQATTVSFVHRGLMIYFGCGRDSQKARNLKHSDKVSVTVNLPYRDWNEIRGLSLGGHAQPVMDPGETRHVLDAMYEKFPQIRNYADTADDEELCLVRVEPAIISLLDYRKGFGHTERFRVHPE